MATNMNNGGLEEKVAKMIAVLAASHDATNAARDDLHRETELLGDAEGSIHTGLGQLGELGTETTTGVESGAEAVATQSAATQDFCGSAAAETMTHVDELSTQHEALAADHIVASDTALAAGLDTLSVQGFAILGGSTAVLFEAAGTALGEGTAAFTEFTSRVDALATELDAFAQVASDAMETIRGQVEELITSGEAAFEEMNGILGDLADVDLPDSMQELNELGEQLYASFLDIQRDLADELVQAGQEIVSEMQEYVAEEASAALLGAFEALAEDIVESLIARLVEAIVMMVTGSTVTGALSPIIPQLAVAKNIAESINDALDALDW